MTLVCIEMGWMLCDAHKLHDVKRGDFKVRGYTSNCCFGIMLDDRDHDFKRVMYDGVSYWVYKRAIKERYT